MTNESRDPLLQSLFRDAVEELDGTALTARVMARTRSYKLLILAGGASMALALLAGAWLIFGLPLFDFALLLSVVLATPLFDLGEGWLALLLLPVNTVASLLVILYRVLRIFQKRIAGISPGGF